ncbi:uncharacterized protein LOC116304583 [Actinia tenebrosa]|uniref:Uncharacterized protein LOC116304583 n=1 Tax=Actinia tenebrosa TaxID=6105 RepID=A0A6P8IVS5_ACTTE|nr:uncharacterized protein LOC116304583 [Actinia tenebrosa]
MGTRIYPLLRQPDFTSVSERRVRPIRTRENGLFTPRNVQNSPRNTGTAKRKLRVRFVLPEDDNIPRKEIEVFPDATEIPGSSSLPAICELMIFSPKMENNNKDNKIRQKTTLPKKAVAAIVGKTPRDSKNHQQKESTSSNIVKLPPATPKYSKQELKIDSNCMMPEDYKDPTQGDTRRRILAWLNEAEKAKPAYRRRMDSFT